MHACHLTSKHCTHIFIRYRKILKKKSNKIERKKEKKKKKKEKRKKKKEKRKKKKEKRKKKKEKRIIELIVAMSRSHKLITLA